jgi:hypothetical protein
MKKHCYGFIHGHEHIDADWDSFSHALIRRFRGIGDGSVKQSNKMQEQQQTFHMDVTKKEGTDSHGKFGKVQQVQEQWGRTREASIHVTETSQKKRIEPNTTEESQVEHRSLKLQSLLLLVAAPSETVPPEPELPDSGHPVMVLPRRARLPKPPDLDAKLLFECDDESKGTKEKERGYETTSTEKTTKSPWNQISMLKMRCCVPPDLATAMGWGLANHCRKYM